MGVHQVTITEFLLARIAEDEAVARAAIAPDHMHPYGDRAIPAIKPDGWGALVDNYLGGPMGAHCARHTPTRVLAECAAKRAIVAHAQDVHDSYREDQFAGGAHAERIVGSVGWLYPFDVTPALRALAAVYASHPDYLQEWAL